MTKASEVRSILRRRMLEKAAVTAGKPLLQPTQFTHYRAPKDYQGAGILDAADKIVGGAEKIRNGITSAIKPMLTGIGVGFNR